MNRVRTFIFVLVFLGFVNCSPDFLMWPETTGDRNLDVTDETLEAEGEEGGQGKGGAQDWYQCTEDSDCVGLYRPGCALAAVNRNSKAEFRKWWRSLPSPDGKANLCTARSRQAPRRLKVRASCVSQRCRVKEVKARQPASLPKKLDMNWDGLLDQVELKVRHGRGDRVIVFDGRSTGSEVPKRKMSLPKLRSVSVKITAGWNGKEEDYVGAWTLKIRPKCGSTARMRAHRNDKGKFELKVTTECDSTLIYWHPVAERFIVENE